MLDLVHILPTLAAIFRQRHDLVVENLLLRHQLQFALRSRPRPHLKSRDRFFWLVVRRLYPAWRRQLVLVRPETVLGWHRNGWRLYWTWRSHGRIGRPRMPAEVKELFAQISRDNRFWGTERIRGELLKLGIVVSTRSIRRYLVAEATPRRQPGLADLPQESSQRIWAADLFVVQTVACQVVVGQKVRPGPAD